MTEPIELEIAKHPIRKMGHDDSWVVWFVGLVTAGFCVAILVSVFIPDRSIRARGGQELAAKLKRVEGEPIVIPPSDAPVYVWVRRIPGPGRRVVFTVRKEKIPEKELTSGAHSGENSAPDE